MHPTPAPQLASAGTIHRSGPKLDRSTVENGVSMEEWNMFEPRWAIFKEGSHSADENASHYLCQCADMLLGDLLLKTDPDKVSKDVHEVLRALKKLAVIPIATCIVRSELLGMK